MNTEERQLPYTTQIQIRAPKFNLYEQVTLYWNNQECRTKIGQRWFNPDDGPSGYWFYKVSEDGKLYPEEVLEPRDD